MSDRSRITEELFKSAELDFMPDEKIFWIRLIWLIKINGLRQLLRCLVQKP